MFRKLLLLSLIWSVFPNLASSQNMRINRVDPPSWWVDMHASELELMIYGNNIAGANVILDYEGVKLVEISQLESP